MYFFQKKQKGKYWDVIVHIYKYNIHFQKGSDGVSVVHWIKKKKQEKERQFSLFDSLWKGDGDCCLLCGMRVYVDASEQ